MKKTVFSKIFSTIAIMTMVFAMVPFQTAHATGSENVVGYAFSDMPDGSDQNKPCTGIDPADTNNEHCGRGLGWISLNSINHAGSINYGVNLNRTTGNFEGNGYAEYGGWVKFNPSGPFPSGPGTVASGAKVDPVCLADVTKTCKVTGWIRFIAAKDEDTNTAGWQGWDGWVSLSGTGYGLELDKPDTNGVRKFIAGGDHYAWGSWIVGWVDFSNASVIQDMCLDIDGVQTSVPADRERDVFGNCPPKIDHCPTTIVTNPDHPKYNQNDPKTIGTQSQDDIANMGYSVNPPLPALNAKCGIFDCTIKGYPQYNGSATISDNSLCQCPAGKTFVDGQCKGDISTPGSDICPSTIPYGGTTYDPKTVGDQTQSDIDAIGYEVVGGKCGIFGCKDPKATNYSTIATIGNNSCTYDVCPNGSAPVNGRCPGDICRDGVDQYSNELIDQEDPRECPTKGPKQPVYCETGGRNCPTGGTVQP